MKKTFILSALFIASSSFAGSLTTVPGPVVIEGITTAQTGVATVAEGVFPLAPTGAGVRNKKILVLNAKIYVAQLFVDQIAKFTRTPVGADVKTDASALSSLANMNSVALKIDFVRNLDAASIVESFNVALKANGLNAETDPGLKKVLAAISEGGDMAKKDVITIVGVNGATTDKLYVENSSGVADVIESDNKLVDKFFAIWLGIPADDGLATLKLDLSK